ncbi:hypothetical protein KI387_020377, partial [Taxus chinensis]
MANSSFKQVKKGEVVEEVYSWKKEVHDSDVEDAWWWRTGIDGKNPTRGSRRRERAYWRRWTDCTPSNGQDKEKGEDLEFYEFWRCFTIFSSLMTFTGRG